MKRLFVALLAVAMLVSMTACGTATKEADYKLGMGIDVSTASSKAGTAQVDATVATVILDKDGKIVDCKLDVAQSKLGVADGELEEGAADKAFKTKQELKEDYNMKPASGIGKEWYEQAKFLEDYVVGKTAAEVAAIATVEKNGHPAVPADADLTAGCTMDIGAFKAAIAKACADDQAKSFKASAMKLGLAATTSVDASSKAADDENDGSANIYSTFSAMVVDANGKTLAAIVDSIQPKIGFDAEGEITEAKYTDTKRVLKDNYNMVKFSQPGTCIAEWYVQANALTDYVVGKTADEIKAIATADTRNDGYMRPTDADLAAKCTMQIPEYQEVMAKAIGLAD